MGEKSEVGEEKWKSLDQHARMDGLESLAEQYRDVLTARRRTPQHVRETHSRIKRLLGVAELSRPDQLQEARIELGLGRLLDTGISLRTANAYLKSMQAFCGWLVRNGHLRADPTQAIPAYKQDTDRRHERTAFTDEQLASLLETAAASLRTLYGVKGPDRAMLYFGAACTGQRLGTLAQLTIGQFDLAAAIPHLHVRADQQKSGRANTIPIHPASGRRLLAYFGEKPRQARAFIMPRHKSDVSKMLQMDLAIAGIPYCVEVNRGRQEVLDFHAIRHSFCSRGLGAGVPLTIMQAWMNHSSPTLTARYYSHVLPHDTEAAIKRLPPLPGT